MVHEFKTLFLRIKAFHRYQQTATTVRTDKNKKTKVEKNTTHTHTHTHTHTKKKKKKKKKRKGHKTEKISRFKVTKITVLSFITTH